MTTQQKRYLIIRRISVCSPSYIPFKSCCLPHPVVRLAGQCLQDCGFGIGQVVGITCGPGRLIITLAGAQTYTGMQTQLQQQNIGMV